MSIKKLAKSKRKHNTSINGCDCEDFAFKRGSYIFHDFLTGESYAGCRHMFDLYVAQGAALMDRYSFFKKRNAELEERIPILNSARIRAEQELMQAMARIKVLEGQLRRGVTA